jgi:MoaA/NifB/PqqE/SkfB family radical SAM enzyme
MENKIWRITLDTNPEDCNLNCIMCEEHSQYSNFKDKLYEDTGVRHRRMSKEMIINLMEQAHQMGIKEVIPTTMGDPLVSDSFDLIVNLAEKYNIKLNVTHNGTFPRKSVKEWADMIVPNTNDIKISFNGATKKTSEKIMRGINFNKTQENIKEFIKYRDEYFAKNGHFCRISFQLTFMRNNMHEIIEIIDIARKLGVNRIKGHHLWAHFPEIKHLSFYYNEDSIKEWNNIVLKVNEFIKNGLANKSHSILLENFEPISDKSEDRVIKLNDCPFLGKELWISATGKISPCCAPDNLRQSLGDFGTFPEIGLNDVVKSDAYQNLIYNYKEIEVCKNCVMRK